MKTVQAVKGTMFPLHRSSIVAHSACVRIGFCGDPWRNPSLAIKA